MGPSASLQGSTRLIATFMMHTCRNNVIFNSSQRGDQMNTIQGLLPRFRNTTFSIVFKSPGRPFCRIRALVPLVEVVSRLSVCIAGAHFLALLLLGSSGFLRTFFLCHVRRVRPSADGPDGIRCRLLYRVRAGDSLMG